MLEETRQLKSGKRTAAAPTLERVRQPVLCLPVTQRQGFDPSPVVAPPGSGQEPASRELPRSKHLRPTKGAVQDRRGHGRGLAPLFLPASLDEVAPDREDGQAFQGPLAALAERDGLPAVTGLAMSEQEIRQVDGEERVARGSAGGRGSDPVMEPPGGTVPAQSLEGAPVGGVIIAVQDQVRSDRRLPVSWSTSPAWEQGMQQLDDPRLHGLGIRSSQRCFEDLPAPLLCRGHGSLASQGAVGEVIEEPGLGPDSEVEVEGEELGVLEGLEAVDDEGFADGSIGGQLLVAEEAVASGSGELADDGRVGDLEESRDLAETGSLGGKLGDAGQEIAPA